MKQFVAVFMVLGLCGSASARNEPDDLPIFSDSQTVGSLEVTREQQYSGAVRLVISYSGESESEALAATIRIFYWEGTRSLTLPMKKVDGHFEMMITNGCLVGEFAGCAVYGTQEMRHLLYWAVAPQLQLNALNFEVSVDSKNFQFGFPQQNSL